MSGVEILGLAASVIQIAELGGKLSVKLFTFTRKVKNANKSIDALSQDIAATGAVLQQLGEAFSKDDQLRVCSQDAINTARTLVEDAKKVFEGLEKLIDGDQKTVGRVTLGAVWKQRLKFPFLEPQIEQVRANLERLKSSLLVILNVLIFAEQLRNREALPILNDQRELIRVLAQEKDQNQRRHDQLLKAIGEKSAAERAGPLETALSMYDESLDHIPINLSTTTTLVEAREPTPKGPKVGSTVTDETVTTNTALAIIDLPEGLRHHHARIKHHADLVQNVLAEIGDWRYNLDHGTRDRMHTGVLEIHWKEWANQRRKHGSVYFERMLADYDDIMNFWKDKLFMEDFDEADHASQPQIGAPDEGRNNLSPSQVYQRRSAFTAPVQRLGTPVASNPDAFFREDAFQRADSVMAQLREQADAPHDSTVKVLRPDPGYHIPTTHNENVARAGPLPYSDLSFTQRPQPDALPDRFEMTGPMLAAKPFNEPPIRPLEEGLRKAAEARREEVERKRLAYLQSRQDKRGQVPESGTPVFDFDRDSPKGLFEGDKVELVPHRRPPAAPSASQTLAKANSLHETSQHKSWSSMDSKRLSNTLHPASQAHAFDTPEEWYFFGEKPKQGKPAQDIPADRDFVFVEKRHVEVNALADDLLWMPQKSNQTAGRQSSTAVPAVISPKEQLDPSEQKPASYERRSDVESSPAATTSAPRITSERAYAGSDTSEGVADSDPETPANEEEHGISQIPEGRPASQPSLESSSSGADRPESKNTDSTLVLDDVDKLIMQFANVNGADLQWMKQAS